MQKFSFLFSLLSDFVLHSLDPINCFGFLHFQTMVCIIFNILYKIVLIIYKEKEQ